MVEHYLLSNLDSEVNHTWSNDTSAPDYMLRIYKHMASKKQHTTHGRSSFREAIRGYYVADNDKNDLQNLVFNLSCQPVNETITRVELVFSRCSSTQDPLDSTASSLLNDSDINVTISMMLDESESIGSVYFNFTLKSNTSFDVINVTDMVLQSLQLKRAILNFTLETSLPLNSSNISCMFERTDEKRPLLVIYENIEPFIVSSNNFRWKRRVKNKSKHPASNPSNGRTVQPATRRTGNPSNPSPNSTNPNHVNCHLTSWYVTFAEIGWQNNIYAPVGYTANYCSGKCPTNLEQTNSTNHALVRSKLTIVSELEPGVPEPFCVPHQTDPLAVLYRNKYNVTISKRFKDMVAVACACL
ncbi:bone morphogenetic protein 2-A-like [Argonauta hians]